jgi:hypothetical protein
MKRSVSCPEDSPGRLVSGVRRPGDADTVGIRTRSGAGTRFGHAAVAFACLLRHPARIAPVVGSVVPGRTPGLVGGGTDRRGPADPDRTQLPPPGREVP